jgi:UDP-N-acetylmuramate--alanine ligase
MALKAVKQISGKRIVTIFQPHRYSRTQDLFHEFVTSFYDTDVLVITDIYPAGEHPIPGINGQAFYEGIKKHGHKDVVFIPDLKEAEKHLRKFLKAGDVLLTLGAGDIWHAGENIMNNLDQ